MTEKVCCAIQGSVSGSRLSAGKASQAGGSRASQRRACGDGTLEKRVADAMNARTAARAAAAQQAAGRNDSGYGVHPALLLELKAIWQQVDDAYAFGGEWQRSFALGEVADRLAVIISDAHTLLTDSDADADADAPGVADLPSSDVSVAGPSEGLDALRELVELRDLRDAIDGGKAGDDELEAMMSDYEKRMPLAWARARRAVAAGSAPAKHAQSQSRVPL